MNSVLFPALLAGPIIRRLDTSQVYIWVAMSKEYSITADVYLVNTIDGTEKYSKINSITNTQTIQFGKNLFIHLIQITPTINQFPTNEFIGYNLHFENQEESFDLGKLGLLTHSNEKSIVYDSFKYPTFFYRKRTRS
ncbi:MAG TPA: hypothetical protein VNS08_17715 [Ureibacillus sp.]|nr:hypothetical protein [Ureibacillus sp.]